MTTPALEAMANDTFAVKVAQDIFRLITGPKVLMDPEGHLLAESPDVDDAFRAALRESTVDAAGAPSAVVARVFPPGTALAGYRLVERAASSTPATDPTLLHDLRDLLHSLQLTVASTASGGDSQVTLPEVAAIATQVEALLTGRDEVVRVPLGAVIGNLAKALGPMIEGKGARLRLELPEEDLHSPVPRGALTRLLQNLLLNAARQSPGREVTVTLHPAAEAPGAALIDVADAGRGLSADRLDWLTTPAPAQAAPATEAGHGYGLAIVKRALEETGARLEQLPGKPHRLRLHLPPDTVPETASRLAGRRLWLVEDNPTSAGVLAQLLLSAGARCEVHLSGAALLSAAETVVEPPDPVLCDFHLQDHDGAELCRRLQAADFSAPVIILTADATPKTAALALFSGAGDLWQKPLSGARIAARVHAFLAKTAEDPPSPLFDAEIACELLEEAGVATTLQFMHRALREARDILSICEGGDLALIRSAIHSAIGASGITGLHDLNAHLRKLHAKVASSLSWETELCALQQSIGVTEQAIAKIEENGTNAVP